MQEQISRTLDEASAAEEARRDGARRAEKRSAWILLSFSLRWISRRAARLEEWRRKPQISEENSL